MKLDDALIEGKALNLLLLDIDDTILKAKGIYIYKKKNGKEIALTPKQFAKENVTSDNQLMYDFRDFNNAEKMGSSIRNSTPILDVLKFMDYYVSKSWLVGILTARGAQDAVEDALKSWLMYRKGSKLRSIGQKLKEVFAVGDQARAYKGETSSERKAIVIQELSQKYDKIIFVDDDQKNVDFVKSLKLKNVRAIKTSEISSNM